MTKHLLFSLGLLLVLPLTLVGCGGDEDGESDGQTSNGTTNEGTSNGTTATSNGTTSTSNGTTATSNGTTATSNGTTSTSNGTTSTSNGTTATSNGTTSTSNGTTSTSNGTTSTSNGTTPDCEGAEPMCGECGSDVFAQAMCEGGEWFCPPNTEELPPEGCPEQTCDMFGGEVCCDEEGNATPALCPSPSQAYCEDGSTPTDACEENIPEGFCHDQSECERADCYSPGQPLGCGICFEEPNCESDDACAGMGEGVICAPSNINDCTCSGGLICKQGCTDDSCATGQTCEDDGRCRANACEATEDCPEHFDCSDGSCARSACDGDTQCPGGHCVNGRCYSVLGQCLNPPP